jgi:hypothetical protein
VTTGQIYWGAVPFVVIQCIMVALVIIFPQMVMHYKGAQVTIDPKKVEEQMRNLTIPGGGGFGPPPGFGGGIPGLGGPGGGSPGGIIMPGMPQPKAP